MIYLVPGRGLSGAFKKTQLTLGQGKIWKEDKKKIIE